VASSVLLVAATARELFPVDGAQLFCCGVGPVEAAVTTAHELAAGEYAAVLHLGIAGATELVPGTVVIGSESIYSDVLDQRATLPRVDRLEATPDLIRVARTALPEALVRPIATAGRVGGGFDCEVEAMEGFGVLRAASLHDVPAVEIRVISNHVQTADRSQWKITESLDALSQVTARLVPAVLRALGARA
jgi:futalosine hydrolase